MEEDGSSTWRVFVKRFKTRPKVCFDRFKITNAIRNIHDAAPRAAEPRDGYFMRVTRRGSLDEGATVISGEKNNIVPDRWAPKCSLTLSHFLEERSGDYYLVGTLS